MSYKYINEENFRNNRVKSSRGSAVVSMLIGAVMWFIGIFLTVKLSDTGFLIAMGLIGLFFILGGIYFWNQPKVMEKKLRALDDPNSRSYKKKQAELEKKRQKYLDKAGNHKSLKFILGFRQSVIYGISFLLSILFTLFFIIIGIIPIFLFVTDALLCAAFVYALSGKQYRVLMDGYNEHGLDREEAESDFAGSRAYIVTNEVMAVSSRFFLSSSEAILLSLSDIVWIFSAYDNVDHYRRGGIYNYTSRSYHLIIGLENGMMIKTQCPEELCPVILDDIMKNGISVTSGYSEELETLYKNDPEHFRNALKPVENIIYTPVGPEFKA